MKSPRTCADSLSTPVNNSARQRRHSLEGARPLSFLAPALAPARALLPSPSTLSLTLCLPLPLTPSLSLRFHPQTHSHQPPSHPLLNKPNSAANCSKVCLYRGEGV